MRAFEFHDCCFWFDSAKIAVFPPGAEPVPERDRGRSDKSRKNMTERLNLFGTIKAMKPGQEIRLPWAKYEEGGFRADYVRSAAARITTDYGNRYKVSAVSNARYITITRIS